MRILIRIVRVINLRRVVDRARAPVDKCQGGHRSAGSPYCYAKSNVRYIEGFFVGISPHEVYNVACSVTLSLRRNFVLLVDGDYTFEPKYVTTFYTALT